MALPNLNIPVFNPALEVELLRSVCSGSFYRFVQEFWSVVVAEKPVWNWHCEYLCQKLQGVFDDVVAGRPKKYDLIINLPPGSSKSSIFSILFPAYAWCRMPSCRFITASFNEELATGFAVKSKNVIQSDLYRKCFGRFRFSPDRMGHYTNQYKGERIVYTTGQSPTGQHAHFILIDDPIDPLVQDRTIATYNVNTWMHRVVRSRTVDAQITPLILVMQRLSVDDPTGEWLTKMQGNDSKILHICLPASIESGQAVKPPGLKRYYQDQLFDPVRLPRKVLDERKLWMSGADYSAQYDQEPLPKEGLMFKVQNIHVKRIDELDPVVAKVRYWDKAISTGVNACYTVGSLVGRTSTGKFVVLDVQRGQWDAATREQIIVNTAKADGPKTVIGIEQEPGPIWEEEEVLMASGLTKPLKSVVVGDYVINCDGRPTKVLAVHKQGLLECRRIRTYDDRSVCGALNHPFLTDKGYVNVADLERGSILRCIPMNAHILADDEISDIHEAGTLPCRCLTVENGESFVVNDFVVHNSGGIESAMYTVRNLAGFPVHVDRASQSKEARAETLAIQVEHGNVFMVEGNWNIAFLSEIGSFPRGKFKDQVDATVGAFRMLCGAGNCVAGAL